MRIIKTIKNVNFATLGDFDVTDENIGMKFEPKHGTVLYVAGMVEGDEDALICLGAEDGSDSFGVAFYEPFRAFDTMWNELMKL